MGIALLILILNWVFGYVVTEREREKETSKNPIKDEIYQKFKKMLNGEKSGENDIKTSRKINRLLLSKKYKVILKKIPLTGKVEEERLDSFSYQIFTAMEKLLLLVEKRCHIVVKDTCHLVVFLDFINLYHFQQI